MIFRSFMTVAALLLQVQAKAENAPHFRCDVPDDWLFGGVDDFAPGEKWPNATVKYELHDSLNETDIHEVQKAFDDIQSKTCIRFEPRVPDEEAYTSIEVNDRVCGMAHSCRKGGYQYTQFGSTCRDWNTMVHELGHTLCLGHEQARKDRDEFVHFKGCTGTAPIDLDGDLRGSLYDYASQMHYQCGWCLGGWPRVEGVTSCGNDIQQGLSVLDADKLNDFYDCGDCLAHRWKPIDALTDTDRRDMPRFGDTEKGQPLYICRGLIDGEIAIGKYSSQS